MLGAGYRDNELISYPILFGTTCYWSSDGDGGYIYLNDVEQVANTSDGDTGSFTVAVGDIVKATRFIGIRGTSCAFVPERNAYYKTGVNVTRGTTQQITVWAKDGGTIEMRVDDPDAVSPTDSLTLAAGATDTFSIDTSSAVLYFSSSDTKFLANKHVSNNTDVIMLFPASNRAVGRNGASASWGAAPSYYSYGTTFRHYYGDDLFNVTIVADGAGTDAEQAVPYDMLCDTYIVDHDIDGFVLGAVVPCEISVYEWVAGDWSLYGTYDYSAASSSNPLGVSAGSVSGSGATICTGPVKFVGTERFFMRTNANQDEYTPIGHNNRYRRFRR